MLCIGIFAKVMFNWDNELGLMILHRPSAGGVFKNLTIEQYTSMILADQYFTHKMHYIT